MEICLEGGQGSLRTVASYGTGTCVQSPSIDSLAT
jgi:tetrahydromethanopterin S-methyltransferase subunit C